MFSRWLMVILYSTLMVKYGAESNSTISSQVVPVAKSQYDRMMILRRNYWKVRTKHDLIKDNWKRIYRIDKVQQKMEIKKCRSRLRDERDQFHAQFKQIDSEINSLTQYRFLSIVKNQISEFDLHSVDFSPNMFVVNPKFDPSNRQPAFEELRRQRWDYLFENRMDLPEMKNIIVGISEAGIHYKDFSKRIARGYEILWQKLQIDPNKGLDYVPGLDELPDLNRTIVGDLEIDKCLFILMKNYDSRDSICWQD